MGSKTKIVVLHMKEIIYTTIFIVLGILLLLLLFFMFLPEKKEGSPGAKQYQPSIYTSTLTLNNTDPWKSPSTPPTSILSVSQI